MFGLSVVVRICVQESKILSSAQEAIWKIVEQVLHALVNCSTILYVAREFGATGKTHKLQMKLFVCPK